MKSITFEVKITVKYNLENERPEWLKSQLFRAADFLANRGLLTPDGTPATVDKWSVNVKEIGRK